MLYLIIGLLFLLADQYLKFWTVAHIELNAFPGKELIPGVLNMTYIKNAGVAFGLFSKFSALRWVLLGLLIAFTLFIVLGIARGFLRTGFARWTGALLLAGLLGNGIDRAIYGFVVDMFEPKLGSITWPIFNLADCLVVFFGILFCIAVLAGGIGAPEEDEYEDEEEEEEPPRRRRRARDEEEDERPRRRARDDEDERPKQRRVRHEDDEDERPRQRRVRHEDEEAPRRRHEGQDASRQHRRPHGDEERRRVRHTGEEAPVRQRRVRTDDGDVTESPAPRKPQRPAAETPESEATVTTVSRPAPKPVQEAPRPAAPAPKPAAAPEPAPAPKAEPKADADEFDLDSILAEFK